ncbi:hypothetical protein L0F63_006656, partial [Massospora cicadina]
MRLNYISASNPNPALVPFYILKGYAKLAPFIEVQPFNASSTLAASVAAKSSGTGSIKFVDRKAVAKSGEVYQPMIGLEIHAQIQSKWKLFS